MEVPHIPEKHTANAPKFDYGKFQEQLFRRAERPSAFAILKENVVNSALEKSGVRKHESSISTETSEGNTRILFHDTNGHTLDPVSEFIDSIPAGSDLSAHVRISIVPGGDFDAIGHSVTGDVRIPEEWVDGKRRHQGLKILHELGHIALIRENPNRRYILDDLLVQQNIAEIIYGNDQIPTGDMIAVLQNNVADGTMSDLGIHDADSREQYFRSLIEKTSRLQKTDQEAFTQAYGELSLNIYIQKVQLERDAWAKALQMFRRARDAGFVIDNRRLADISLTVNTALAMRVRPDWTFAVHGAIRKTLGLPADAETIPTVSNFPIEQALQQADTDKRRHNILADAISHYLQLDGDINGFDDMTVTSPDRIDSRVISGQAGLFSDEQPIRITREAEMQSRLAVTCVRKSIAMTEASMRKLISSGDQERYYGDPKLFGKIRYESVKGVEDRNIAHFCMTDIGMGYSPHAVYSYWAVIDRNVDPDLPMQPMNETSNQDFLYATRIKPESDEGYVGMQIVGSVSDVVQHADHVPLRTYLADQGYDPQSLGSIRVSQLGFCGFRNKATQ